MAGSVNKVILLGNLGKDPEVRRLESGAAVASFPLATNESYKDRNGQQVTNTEWHNIVMWRGLAEVAERYLKKGSLIYVEGKIQTRSYQDQDGNTRYITEIVAREMSMVGGRGEGDAAGERPQNAASNEPNQTTPSEKADDPISSANDVEDDLPF
jgi:single-strand DNA-binding protein